MSIPLGYINNEQLQDIRGKQVRFRDLQRYVGKKVLLEMPRESAIGYRVVRITWFLPDVEGVYDAFTLDEIGKTDKAGISIKDGRKEHGSISELYTNGGRWDDDSFPYRETVYEIKGESYE